MPLSGIHVRETWSPLAQRLVILVSNVLPHRDAGLKAIISGVCVIIGEARRTGYVSAETHVQTLCLTRISSCKHDIIHHVGRYLSFTRDNVSLRNSHGYFRFGRCERPFKSGLVAPNIIIRDNSTRQNRPDTYPRIGKFNLNAMHLRQINIYAEANLIPSSRYRYRGRIVLMYSRRISRVRR